MREPDRIIRLKTVLARTGPIHHLTQDRGGTFPGTNGTGWRESEISRWIADPVSWRPKQEFDEVG